jgi:transposase-like protein
MTVEERRRRRFSEEFRKDSVKRIQNGEITPTQIGKLYEVKVESIKRWIKKYGDGSYKSRIVVSFGEEIEAIKNLESEIKKLRSIIADQQIEISYYKSATEVAERKLGKDFEKKR